MKKNNAILNIFLILCIIAVFFLYKEVNKKKNKINTLIEQADSIDNVSKFMIDSMLLDLDTIQNEWKRYTITFDSIRPNIDVYVDELKRLQE
jgi:CHASE3 domain sensor protein